MAIQIDKAVPVPADMPRRGRAIYPFRKMAVGDSFALPLTGKKIAVGGGHWHAAEAVRLSRAASMHKKAHGGNFTVRTLPEEGIVRIWKVAE